MRWCLGSWVIELSQTWLRQSLYTKLNMYIMLCKHNVRGHLNRQMQPILQLVLERIKSRYDWKTCLVASSSNISTEAPASFPLQLLSRLSITPALLVSQAISASPVCTTRSIPEPRHSLLVSTFEDLLHRKRCDGPKDLSWIA